MDKLKDSERKWHAKLTPEAYAVTREAGTEQAFTGRYWDHHEQGTYCCICCGLELFRSDDKFDSGTGWPSFYQPVSVACSGSGRKPSVPVAMHIWGISSLMDRSQPA